MVPKQNGNVTLAPPIIFICHYFYALSPSICLVRVLTKNKLKWVPWAKRLGNAGLDGVGKERGLQNLQGS